MHDPAQPVIPRTWQRLRLEDERLEPVLRLVVDLATPRQHLEAVVRRRIVRRAHHDPGLEVTAARNEGKAGGGDDAKLQDVDPDARQAGGQGGGQHVAGSPGVLADNDAPPVAFQQVANRPAQVMSERRGQVDIRDTTDAVGPEETCHSDSGTRRG